jgi:hypothetical protein
MQKMYEYVQKSRNQIYLQVADFDNLVFSNIISGFIFWFSVQEVLKFCSLFITRQTFKIFETTVLPIVL